MSTLFNDKDILACVISSVTLISHSYAGILNINSNSTIEMLEAEYVEVLSDILFHHEPCTKDYAFDFSGADKKHLTFRTSGSFELFLDNKLISQSKQHNEQWLLINRRCGTSGRVRVVPKPGNWYVAFTEGDCPLGSGAEDGVTITLLKIDADNIGDGKSETLPQQSLSHDINSLLSPDQLRRVLTLADPMGISSPQATGDVFQTSHQILQKNFLSNPHHYQTPLTEVHLAHIKITGKKNLRNQPGAKLLNQLVEQASSIEELMEKLLPNLNPYLPEDIKLEDQLEEFKHKFLSTNGEFVVKRLYDYLWYKIYDNYSSCKTMLSSMRRPSIGTLVSALLSLSKASSEQPPEESSSEATELTSDNLDQTANIRLPSGIHPDPASASLEGAVGGITETPPSITAGACYQGPTIQLIERLITINNHGINKLVTSIFNILEIPEEERRWREMKKKIRNRDNSISSQAVLQLLCSVSRVKVELEIAMVTVRLAAENIKKPPEKHRAREH